MKLTAVSPVGAVTSSKLHESIRAAGGAACPCHLPVDAVDCLMEHGQCSCEFCIVPLSIRGTATAATGLVGAATYVLEATALCSCEQRLQAARQDYMTLPAKGVPVTCGAGSLKGHL